MTINQPPTGTDGEGIYLRSSSRAVLGAQPRLAQSASACSIQKPEQHDHPHRDGTGDVRFGVDPRTPDAAPEPSTAARRDQERSTARWPNGQFLVSAGFQRRTSQATGAITSPRPMPQAQCVGSSAARRRTGSASSQRKGPSASCSPRIEADPQEVASSPRPGRAGAQRPPPRRGPAPPQPLITGGFSVNGSTTAPSPSAPSTRTAPDGIGYTASSRRPQLDRVLLTACRP